MHLHFERTVNAKSDCSILSLTWMGKVPDELPEVILFADLFVFYLKNIVFVATMRP